MRSMLRNSVGPGLLLAMLAFATPPAVGGMEDPSPYGERSKPFVMLWNVTTDAWDLQSGEKKDWTNMVDFGGVPMVKDIVVLYEHRLGHFPREGPQQFAYNAAMLARHVSKVREDLIRQIPDPDYDGIAVIDYEGWVPWWEINTPEIKRNWREFLESRSPNPLHGLTGPDEERVLRTTFVAVVKEFLIATIDACRETRPNAKWSMYDYPCSYGGTAAVYDNPGANKYRDRNDELQWLWDRFDVFTPSLYSWRATVPEGAPRDKRYEYTPQEHRAFLTALVAESVRLAEGKPVYTYFWPRYLPTAGPRYEDRWFNDVTLDVFFQAVHGSDADGVIIWDNIKGRGQFDVIQEFMNEELIPRLLPLTAVAEAPSGGGALGGGAPPSGGGQPPAGPSGDPGPGGGSGGDAGSGGGSGGGGVPPGGGSPSGGGDPGPNDPGSGGGSVPPLVILPPSPAPSGGGPNTPPPPNSPDADGSDGPSGGGTPPAGGSEGDSGSGESGGEPSGGGGSGSSGGSDGSGGDPWSPSGDGGNGDGGNSDDEGGGEGGDGGGMPPAPVMNDPDAPEDASSDGDQGSERSKGTVRDFLMKNRKVSKAKPKAAPKNIVVAPKAAAPKAGGSKASVAKAKAPVKKSTIASRGRIVKPGRSPAALAAAAKRSTPVVNAQPSSRTTWGTLKLKQPGPSRVADVPTNTANDPH